jgi:hypothetical protein
MIQSNQDVIKLIEQQYVPSEVERKRSLFMYALFGIIVVMMKKKVNLYEFFHLKQATGRRMIFMVCLVGSIVFVFVPFLWVVPVLIFFLMIVARILFVVQARNGKYATEGNYLILPIFSAIGGWFFDLFEFGMEVDHFQTVAEESTVVDPSNITPVDMPTQL